MSVRSSPPPPMERHGDVRKSKVVSLARMVVAMA